MYTPPSFARTQLTLLYLFVVLHLDAAPVLLHVLPKAHGERQDGDDRGLPLHARVDDPLRELQPCLVGGGG